MVRINKDDGRRSVRGGMSRNLEVFVKIDRGGHSWNPLPLEQNLRKVIGNIEGLYKIRVRNPLKTMEIILR